MTEKQVNKFNFTSQICTTKEQSKRLLALGLKKETADMKLIPYSRFAVPVDYYTNIYGDDPDENGFCRAWSLHRLIEMMPSTIQDLYELDFSKQGVYYADFSNGSFNFVQSFAKPDKTLYDNVIDCIEWLIKEDYFNKEYLN